MSGVLWLCVNTATYSNGFRAFFFHIRVIKWWPPKCDVLSKGSSSFFSSYLCSYLRVCSSRATSSDTSTPAVTYHVCSIAEGLGFLSVFVFYVFHVLCFLLTLKVLELRGKYPFLLNSLFCVEQVLSICGWFIQWNKAVFPHKSVFCINDETEQWPRELSVPGKAKAFI